MLTPQMVWAFLLCLLFAFVMQIDANFVNDYFDFKKGTDRADRLGPERACAQGWIRPEAMRRGIVVTTLAGCAVGLPLVWYGGWWMLAVGALCVAGCILYTTHLSYRGWGDILVVVFFGFVPVFFTWWVVTAPTDGEWVEVLLLGLAMGLATDCLLMVNNYRDVEQDRLSGKRTLVVRFGERSGRHAYLWLGIVAAAIVVSLHPKGVFVVLPYLLFHFQTYRLLCRLTGRELNHVLGLTARNIFLFGLLTALIVLFF